jgi:hypothetical protein
LKASYTAGFLSGGEYGRRGKELKGIPDN